jgi:hypothetical protein
MDGYSRESLSDVVKHDGYRIIARKQGEKVRLVAAHDELHRHFSGMAEAKRLRFGVQSSRNLLAKYDSARLSRVTVRRFSGTPALWPRRHHQQRLVSS